MMTDRPAIFPAALPWDSVFVTDPLREGSWGLFSYMSLLGVRTSVGEQAAYLTKPPRF